LSESQHIAFVYGTRAGVGGLGTQSANAAASLASDGITVHALGPGYVNRWPLANGESRIQWHDAPALSSFRAKYLWPHSSPGRLQFARDIQLGRWAADKANQINPKLCYAFTQVGLDTLKWAKRNAVPSALESPNGHIRNFLEVYEQEAARWCGVKFRGHPSHEMVSRVEEEYETADRIRVSSEWSKKTMVERGIPADKIDVLQQPVDLNRFRPADKSGDCKGPLRLCFVGSLDLRKGFVYLLQAMRLIGPDRTELEIVGATGSRSDAKLFARERRGLNVTAAAGDPLTAYHRAELFVLPTLEDGSPFAAAEAMACGLPVVVTDTCGAAEWVKQGTTGWIVSPRDSESLARALEAAFERRSDLRNMGEIARADTERRAGPQCFAAFREWVTNN
jgi:glycosyltransferase involved in cell wall biosynthesis